MAAPIINGITPWSGTLAGGNPVVITGANFRNPDVTSVSFGGTTATFTVNSDSQITATAPAHSLGTVAATVTNATGSAAATYAYTTELSLWPTQGATGGGTTVDIHGSNLAGATQVLFGTKSAISFSQLSPTHLQALSPAGAGEVHVTVIAGGRPSAPGYFYYLPPPFASSLTPDAGPVAGGTPVTISGVNLFAAAAVTFDGVPGIITSDTAGSITVTTPAAGTASSVDVVASTPGGNSKPLIFTYTAAPAITSVIPASGTSAGGDTITIAGTGLGATTQVTVGGTPASFQAASDTQLAVSTPPHTAGVADVVVTSPGGSATAVGAFTYQTPPSY